MSKKLDKTLAEVKEAQEVAQDQVEDINQDVEGTPKDDGEAPMYPGGPTGNQLEKWKSLHKAVYLTEFDEDTVFIWRALTRKEYKDIMKIENADQFYREERICEKCVLWPKGYSFLTMGNGKAGVPSFVAEQIMDKSGFIAKTGALRL